MTDLNNLRALLRASVLAAGAIGSVDFGTYRALRFVLLAVSVAVAIIVGRRATRNRNR